MDQKATDTLPVYDLTVTQMTRMLNHLATFLEKGEAHARAKKIEPDILLSCRLVADQFPLVKQVQIACDVAKFAAARLSGKEAPKHPDTEQTMAETHQRVRSVIQFLGTVKPEDFHGANARKVTQARREGQYIDGRDFLIRMALPNFYFHVTTAYAILRSNGVELGKNDFLGGDLPFKPL
jgi:hypothetical protein